MATKFSTSLVLVDAVAPLVDLGVAGAGEQVVPATGVGHHREHRAGQLRIEHVARADVDAAVQADRIGDPELLGQVGSVEGDEVADLPAFEVRRAAPRRALFRGRACRPAAPSRRRYPARDRGCGRHFRPRDVIAGGAPRPSAELWAGCAVRGPESCALSRFPCVSPGQHQGGIDDQAAAAIVGGARQAGGERGGDLGGKRADRRPSPGGRPRSLSGSSSRAGRRAMAGQSIRPHWRSASRRHRRRPHRAASTVTESAMPSEKERPRAPEVAMPPMPSPAERIVPLRAGTGPREKSPATPMSSVWPGATKHGDVAAVVDVGALERRGGRHGASSSSATAPATAAIGVMKTSANGAQAATMRRATGPSTARPSLIGVRSCGSSAHSSARTPGSARRLPRSAAHRVGPAPSLQHHVDGPVRQVQAPAGQLLDDGAAHRAHPILAERSHESCRLPSAVSGSSVRRDTSAATPSWPRWRPCRPVSAQDHQRAHRSGSGDGRT